MRRVQREDIEAWCLALVFGYETAALLLRKTRWTNKVPPLTRPITKHGLEDAVLGFFKWHFVNHRKRNYR